METKKEIKEFAKISKEANEISDKITLKFIDELKGNDNFNKMRMINMVSKLKVSEKAKLLHIMGLLHSWREIKEMRHQKHELGNLLKKLID